MNVACMLHSRVSPLFRPIVGLALWMATTLPSPVLAQSTDPATGNGTPAETGATTKLEKIEVTGSSIKRIDGETALPVQVLKRADIERSGATTVEQLFQQLAVASSSGATTTAQGTGYTTGGLSAISLRGLGSSRTLILINGLRATVYGGGSVGAAGSSVDINSIPIGAVDRVEVLKDGASAIYGSDAIAGVVNFILRKDFQGAQISTTLGMPTAAGGGDDSTFSVLAGTGDLAQDHYNGMLSLSAQHTNPIMGASRPYATRYNPAYGNDNTSGYAFPANVGTKNPAYPNCGPYSIVDPNFPNRCRFDNSPFDSIQPEQTRRNLLATGHLIVSDSLEAYAELGLNQVTTRTTIQPVPLTGPFTIPTTSLYYPSAFAQANGLAGQPVVVGLLRDFPNGLRVQDDESTATRGVVGLKGLLAGWDYDTSLLFSSSQVREFDRNGFPLVNVITNALNAGLINPFGPTTDPAGIAAANSAQFIGENFNSRTSLTSLSVKVGHELFALPGGAASFAAGAELRRETFVYNPSAPLQAGNIGGLGTATPEDASRQVRSAYLEVDAPVTHSLEADGAVRYDKYDGVGGTVNPKASLRWQPTGGLLVRASAGTGFRAPSLTDLNAAQSASFTGNGSRDFLRCPVFNPNSPDCSAQFNTVLGGNPNLKPETSRSFTLGVLAEPLPNLSVGLDGFWIFLKDAITVGGLSAGTILGSAANELAFANFITRGAPDGNASGLGPILSISQQNANLFKTALSGVDVDFKYLLPIVEGGKITFYGNGTYFNRYDVQNPDGSYSGAIDQGSTAAPGLIARWRYTAGAVLDSGPWSTAFTQNYQKHYHDTASSVTGVLRDVGDYVTYDLQTSYSGFKTCKLTLGAKNLFNAAPPYANYAGPANNFVGGYDLSYGDPRGTFVYFSGTWYLQ